MVRRKKPTSEDWRTPEQREADKALEGTWFRCRIHGQIDASATVILGGHAYCDPEALSGPRDCSESLLLVHSATRSGGEWNACTAKESRGLGAAIKRDATDDGGAWWRGGALWNGGGD